MIDQRVVKRTFVSALLVGAALGLVLLSGEGQVFGQDKKAKDPLEGKKGTTIGTLTEKGPNFIEVKADGEEKGRKYVPEWRGGAPAQGGGPDKEMLKTFTKLQVGSRVEVEWVFHERLRALNVKVLKAADNK
jgi:hypothetical protein